jgi:cytochrome c oxidase assembly factor CtaG
MQWWCSSTGLPWDWGWKAYPGVWLFLGLLAVGILRWNAAGYRAAGARSHDPLRGPLLGLGLAALWLALDWPIGALGAGYLASMHMLQFILIAMVASPFLVRGIAPEALRLLERRPRLLAVLRWLTRPVVALVLFNAIVAVTHVPEIVDTLMASQLGNFLIDVLWLVGGLLFWWPVVAPIPERPRFVNPLKMGYLTLGLMFSPVSIGLSAFLVYSEFPLFRTYELAPPIAGIASRDDHQVAGLMMSVAGSLIAMAALTVYFFRWARETE